MSSLPKLIAVQTLYLDYETKVSPYMIACDFFCGRLVRDRFNQLNQYSEFNWNDTVDPIPKPDSTPLSELMDRRANELIGKSISLQWSGGVDSTAILLSLIKNGISKEDLVVLYDDNSMTEYPKLYEWLRNQKYQMKKVSVWRDALVNTQTDIITNGWCADQLFGSMFFHELPGSYYTPMEELLSTSTFRTGKLTGNQIEEALEAFKAAGRNLGLELNLACELGWFINFTMKWTWVSTFNELYLINTPAFTKTRCFFNRPYFQSWAMNNFPRIKDSNIYGKDHVKYKKPLKEYCYEVFKDQDYLLNKTKNPSWNASVSTQRTDKLQLVIKHNQGYEVYIPPKLRNEENSFKVDESFFTKYKKASIIKG